MRFLKREDGQSVIMVVFVIVVLIALVAVVVDVGNAYAQRRVVQNAADAASLAATRELARGSATTNNQVLAQAKEYAQLNGVDPNTVTARYFSFNPMTKEVTDLGVVPNTATRPPTNADGVTVSVGKTFNTYLAQVVGRTFMDASANSSGQISRGVCTAGSGSGLFPVAVDTGLFDNERDLGKPTPYVNYRIWGDKTAPGNFHWVSWNTDPGHTSDPTLVANLQDTSRSGEWAVDSLLPPGPGVMNSSDVKAQLDVRIADTDPLRPAKVLLPVYSEVTGGGENTRYRIAGFAWFVLTGYNFGGNDKYIEGYFVEDATSSAEGGCLDLGTSTVKLRPPLDLTRNIWGRIAYERLEVTQPTGQTEYPVDVALVIDTSGSMDQYWGSPSVKKVTTAKDAMSNFTNMLRPDIGDQVGLVRFPIGNENIGFNYRTVCNRYRTNYMLRAEILSQLTTNTATVLSAINNLGADGGTPIADAMQRGIEVVAGPNHVQGRPQIIILASDGMTNATLDYRWTGYSGSTTSGMGGCNGEAEAQAVNMANQAKAQGITVFTIAIGTDFSGSLLEAMATPDTDPAKPHFFVASNPNVMEEIYDSLGDRIINYGGECTVTALDSPAAGATITLYKDGAQVAQTQADAAGNFSFENVQPGTYTFSATLTYNGLTYDVFTSKVGGPELSGSPTLVVGEAEGTYQIHLALKTATPPSCSGGV